MGAARRDGQPGYYAATLDTGVRCEITVGEKVAVHRYTFPEARSARVVLDLSCGGLAIEHGRTVPLRAHVESMGHGRAQGTVVIEGVPLSVYLEVLEPGWRQMLWHDRRLIEGGTRLDFDSIRQTTLRPFGLLFMGPGRGRPDPSRCAWASPCAAASRRGRTCGASAAAPSRSSTSSGPAPRRAGTTTSTGSGSTAARPPGARSWRRRSTTR